MRVGVSIPNMGPLTGRPLTIRIAELAEAHHFDSLWVGDHVVMPRRINARYPYPGRFKASEADAVFEPVATLAWLAGITRSVRLGVSVLVMPYRNPVLLTKMFATLDVLSEGRVLLGAGSGWLADEFAILGANYPDRFAVTEEYLHIYRVLCSQSASDFDGRFYSFRDVVMQPPPVQRPHPPIYLGGNGGRALRLAAELADAWQPLSMPVDELAAAVPVLRRHAVAAGREEKSVTIAVRLYFRINPSESSDSPIVEGSPAEVIRAIERYSAAGVEEVLLSPHGASAAEIVEYVDAAGTTILPEVA